MAPVEPWERVWIDTETYAEDVHSMVNCTSCHLGQSVDDMELAHEGMYEDPTADAMTTCGSCHPGITEASMDSLHVTLRGYDEAVYSRTIEELHDDIEYVESYHCNDCHATCGDCHVSQPASVGGGLVNGHEFNAVSSMSRQCTACHGSRVKDDYYGNHEGVPSDVHFRARMACTDCHTGDEMHGMGVSADAAHRYDGPEEPSCESCHEDQVGVGSGILQHELHGTEILSCQGCHSTSYTNCTNCHLDQTDTGIPFYTVEAHELDFAIAKNFLRGADRPYEYVPVRHVPTDVDAFNFYGDDLMPNFDNRPTWSYATPHNIQRITPQTESCLTCHENDDVFLTDAKVVPAERAANAVIMLDHAPPLPEGYQNVITGQEDTMPVMAEDAADSGGDEADSFWGDGGGDAEAEEPADEADSFWGSGEEAAADDSAADEADSFWGGDDSAADESEADAAADDAESFWGG